MKHLFKLKFAVLLLFVFALSAFAQSNAKIERDLVAAIKEVQKYSDYGTSYDEEKLSAANKNFEEKLLKYTKNASTLSYKFAALEKLMQVASSGDGRFRIYSWDSETGGTMHDYSRVYQYQSADGKVYSQVDETAEEDGGAGSFVTDIFTIDAKSGKIYIVCATFIGSTQDRYQSASLYRIDGEKLVDKVKLIKTKSGLTDNLSFEYNFFSVVDRKDRPVKLISFDKNTQTLKIPVVINDKEFLNGKVTNKFINYKFDGTYFVKVN